MPRTVCEDGDASQAVHRLRHSQLRHHTMVLDDSTHERFLFQFVCQRAFEARRLEPDRAAKGGGALAGRRRGGDPA